MSSQNCRIKGIQHTEVINRYIPSLDKIIEIIIKVIDGKSINKNGMPVTISADEIKDNRRYQHVVFVRYLFLFVASKYGYTLHQMGDYLKKNHTLGIHAKEQCQIQFEIKYPLFIHYSNIILPVFGLKLETT